ncbi:MAG: hypothetical protein KAK00_02650 [Nanoarchaeota archaeon]|nr:hypothetical protein [Nanoarchaeota archaeon]
MIDYKFDSVRGKDLFLENETNIEDIIGKANFHHNKQDNLPSGINKDAHLSDKEKWDMERRSKVWENYINMSDKNRNNHPYYRNRKRG